MVIELLKMVNSTLRQSNVAQKCLINIESQIFDDNYTLLLDKSTTSRNFYIADDSVRHMACVLLSEWGYLARPIWRQIFGAGRLALRQFGVECFGAKLFWR